ncbi:Terpenoid synthase 22 [Raphanus sativus]|nr:Terpenoid synthase 22 [Raphanus sativus]
MCFGPKILPHLRNGDHLYLPTKLSLFLHNKVALSRRTTKHKLLLCVKATSESSRPLTHFAPSLWGDHFLSAPLDYSEYNTLEIEMESVYKPNVRNMLMSSPTGDKEKICLIHLLVNLGIFHYFEKEIEDILDEAFLKLDSLFVDENGLETTAIMFEVFRRYGHHVSCDVFDRFKGDDDAKFREHLVRDVRGMIQLYEAAHLGTPSECIMDEALSFTRFHLESLASQEATTPPHLSRHILSALYRPRFLKMEIEAAREYISFYQVEEGRNEMLLTFAKLNFKLCQLHYLQELETLTKWWKETDLAYKLPYVRDRLLETFVGALATYFEPRYSLGRIIVSKISIMMVVMDDTCDAYGSFPEVRSLIDSLQRWDLGAIDELPSHLRIVIQSIVDTMEDIKGEMKPRGRSCSVQYTVEEIKRLGRAYANISKWARAGYVPTFDEYMEVGIDSSGVRCFAMYTFMAMEDCDEDQTIEWFKSEPRMIRALCVIFRLENDIGGFEIEMRRGEVANGVNCYMKQHGVTKEVAVREIKNIVKDNCKIVMEEFLTIKDVPRPILVRCINTIRLVNVYYREGDGFSDPHGNLKDLITSLLINPLSL